MNEKAIFFLPKRIQIQKHQVINIFFIVRNIFLKLLTYKSLFSFDFDKLLKLLTSEYEENRFKLIFSLT